MADPQLGPFLDEAVAASVATPPKLALGTDASMAASSAGLPGSAGRLDQALFQNAQDVVDELVPAVAEIRLDRLAGLLDLLLQRQASGAPLYADDQIHFVLVVFELAAGEPLIDALTRLTKPPHTVATAHDRLVGLHTKLIVRLLAIVTERENRRLQSGVDRPPPSGLPTHVGTRAARAVDWLPLDLVDADPLAGTAEAGHPDQPLGKRIIGEKLTAEELHGRLVNLRGFASVPHAGEVRSIGIEARIKMRRRRINLLQSGEIGKELSPEERQQQIETERKNIKADEKRLRNASDLSASERARHDYDRAREALQADPDNTGKKAKFKAAAERLSLYDPHIQEYGGPLGHGTKTFVVMQLELPDAPPIIAEGTNTSQDHHAETHALAVLQQHLEDTYELEDPKVKTRIAAGKLTVMPDQIVCHRKCRPDIARFAQQNGLADVKAVYVVRKAGNAEVGVVLGEVSIEPAGNKEEAIQKDLKRRGLAQVKTTTRTAATGKTAPDTAPHLVVTEDLLSDDLKLEYRKFESNLPVPAPTGRRPKGPSSPSAPRDVEPPKVRFQRVRKLIRSVGRALLAIARATLTALEILEPLLVFAEGLDVALGKRPADLYRRKVSGLNTELRRQVLRLRQADDEGRQVSVALLGLHFSGEAVPDATKVQILGELKALEVETYGAMLSLLSRRDLARQSMREADAQEEVARKLLYTKDRQLLVLFGSQGAGGLPLIHSTHQALLKLRPVIREHLLLLDEMIRLMNLDYLFLRSWFAFLSGETSTVQIPDALLAPVASDYQLRVGSKLSNDVQTL